MLSSPLRTTVAQRTSCALCRVRKLRSVQVLSPPSSATRWAKPLFSASAKLSGGPPARLSTLPRSAGERKMRNENRSGENGEDNPQPDVQSILPLPRDTIQGVHKTPLADRVPVRRPGSRSRAFQAQTPHD